MSTCLMKRLLALAAGHVKAASSGGMYCPPGFDGLLSAAPPRAAWDSLGGHDRPSGLIRFVSAAGRVAASLGVVGASRSNLVVPPPPLRRVAGPGGICLIRLMVPLSGAASCGAVWASLGGIYRPCLVVPLSAPARAVWAWAWAACCLPVGS